MLEVDLHSLPIPALVVKKIREDEVYTEGPEENIVTETAFKSRTGLTFKQANTQAHVTRYEVEPGRYELGLTELVGKEGVYKRRRVLRDVAQQTTGVRRSTSSKRSPTSNRHPRKLWDKAHRPRA